MKENGKIKDKKVRFSLKLINRKALICIISIISVIAIFSEYSAVSFDEVQGIPIYVKFMAELLASMQSVSVYHLFLFVCMCYFYDKFYFKGEKIKKANCILAFGISLILVLGYSFRTTNSWDILFSSGVQIFKTVIKFSGNYIMSYAIIKALLAWLEKFRIRDKISNNNILLYIFEKDPKCIVLILLVLWLPYIIIMYPGVMMPDSVDQIWQVIDPNTSLNNHHPILSSLIMGNLVKLGNAMHVPELGLYTYVLLQISLLIYTISYSFKLMRKMNISYKIQMWVLIFYIFCPIICLYALSVLKDTLFSICAFYYILMLIEMIIDSQVLEKKAYLIRFSVLIFLVLMFRHNGFYFVAPSILALLIYLKRYRKKILICLVVPLILYEGLTKMMYPLWNIKPSNIREALSVPFQQTARTLHEGKQYSENDLNVINKVLDVETITKEYNPVLSDKVKNTYKVDTCTKEQLKDYFFVWAKYFAKYPSTYIEATLNNTSGYLDLDYPDEQFIEYLRGPGPSDLIRNLNWKNIYTFQNYRDVLIIYIQILQRTPIIGTLLTPAIYNWGVIVLAVYILLIKKKREYSAVFVALLVLILVCIMSPFVALRYMLVIVYSIPILSVLSIYISKGDRLDLGGK